MTSDTAYLTPRTMLIFLDETGHELYSDPNHPVFGIGGAATGTYYYIKRLQKAWQKLKADDLKLAGTTFHAVEFERSRPDKGMILAINKFMSRGFHRIAVTTDIHTKRPVGYDGHETVSTVIFEYIKRLIGRYCFDRCMIFFEDSERGNKLLQRNLPLGSMNARNLFDKPVEVCGFLLPKSAMEPGLELADLIIHTAGKQQRKHIGLYSQGIRQFNPDFSAVFHSVGPSWVSYESVVSMSDNSEDDLAVEHWPEF